MGRGSVWDAQDGAGWFAAVAMSNGLGWERRAAARWVGVVGDGVGWLTDAGAGLPTAASKLAGGERQQADRTPERWRAEGAWRGM